MKSMEARAQKKLSETNMVLNHSVRQLENTQKLLHVMRQGKAEANEEQQAMATNNKWPAGDAVISNPKAA